MTEFKTKKGILLDIFKTRDGKYLIEPKVQKQTMSAYTVYLLDEKQLNDLIENGEIIRN